MCAATRSVFGEPFAAGAEERRVPELLRRVRLRRANRNELRSRWAARVERGRLARAVNDAVGKILAEAAREAAAAARAAAPVSAPAPADARGAEERLR